VRSTGVDQPLLFYPGSSFGSVCFYNLPIDNTEHHGTKKKKKKHDCWNVPAFADLYFLLIFFFFPILLKST